jgi:hypothetical protein
MIRRMLSMRGAYAELNAVQSMADVRVLDPMRAPYAPVTSRQTQPSEDNGERAFPLSRAVGTGPSRGAFRP